MRRNPHIRALSRGLTVLEAFSDGQSLSQIEIAQRTGLPYPTVWRILMTLVDAGMIQILPVSDRYSLTSRALALSAGFQDRLNLLARFRAGIDALGREFLWPMSLAVPAGNKMVMRYGTHSATSMTYTVFQPGFATPLGNSAGGIAYLAALPAAEAELLTAGLALTRLERETLEGQVAAARPRGHAAYERTQFNPTPGKTSTIAVPVYQHDHAVGAISLTFFANAMTVEAAVERYVPGMLELAATPELP